MNQSELRGQVFDTILKAAAAESFQRELDAIPPEEELKKSCPVSQDLDQRIRNIIRRAYRRIRFQKATKFARKVAVVLAIIIPVSLGSLLSVEASRNAIFNAILDWKSDHVDISIQDRNSRPSGQPSGSNEAVIKPGYLPAGFAEQKEMKIGPMIRTVYQNSKNESILFDRSPLAKGGKMGIDSEHSVYSEILINGKKASLFAAKTPQDTSYLLWQDKTTSYVLSSTIGQEELIKMAESMK